MKAKVRLTTFEMRTATALANQRSNDNQSNGVTDRNQSGEDKTIEGCAAELAVAAALNVYPDLQSGNFKAGDLRMFGDTVDIKWNNGGRYMNCVKWKDKPGKRCRYYVAVSGTPPDMVIHGWITDRELFQEANIKDIGNGPYYRFPLDKMHKFSPYILSGRSSNGL